MVESSFLLYKESEENAEVVARSTQLMKSVLLILMRVIHWLEMKQQLIYLLDHGQTMQYLTGAAP